MIQKENGQSAYRTDLYSRAQIGRGDVNPRGESYTGPAEKLDGVVSCSVILEPELVHVPDAGNDGGARTAVGEVEFWRDEFDHSRPFSRGIDDRSNGDVPGQADRLSLLGRNFVDDIDDAILAEHSRQNLASMSIPVMNSMIRTR
jgi:hypothetical protein